MGNKNCILRTPYLNIKIETSFIKERILSLLVKINRFRNNRVNISN